MHTVSQMDRSTKFYVFSSQETATYILNYVLWLPILLCLKLLMVIGSLCCSLMAIIFPKTPWWEIIKVKSIMEKKVEIIDGDSDTDSSDDNQ